MDIFADVSNETRDEVEMKTEFNDVMHFATLIPFLLADSKEEKARTAYYQSVILMNDFCKKYGV